MSVLVVSADEEAARSLCAALQRSGRSARWESDLEGARKAAREAAPLVLVADAALPGCEGFLSEAQEAESWTRVYLMADPSVVPSTPTPILFKPFDASEVADLLAREVELADLERVRQRYVARADELALLVEASFEAIIGLAADGTIRSWNPGAAAIYGYHAEEVVGRHIDILDVDPSAPSTRLASKDRAVVEVVRRRKDGSDVVVLLSVSPIVGQSGPTLGFAEVSLNVTERHKLQRALEHGERLAALGRLAASMAHEINNPLAVIQAAATHIRNVASKAGHTELVETVADLDLAVERIASFVQHVCGFARRERTVLSDASLGQTLSMAVRLVRARAANSGVKLEMDEIPDVRVLHDPPRLAQAILNLVANAVDAAAAGRCTVSIRVVEEAGKVKILVDDDGPGIAPEVADKLFEPFATTKPPGEGTGLGLAITAQIVADHAGSVEIVPREGGGTRAVLTLPRQDLKRFLVLVIDREPTVRRALATDVGSAGFRVRSAGSIAQARTFFDEEDVRVVVTDLHLPDGDVLALLEEVRKDRPSIGLVLVTADRIDTAVSAECVFAKPWDRDQLVATVRSLCLTPKR